MCSITLDSLDILSIRISTPSLQFILNPKQSTMVSSSTARFSYTTSSTPRKQLWNPSKTLGIINTDPGYQRITCVGHAPSKGRRCRISLRGDNVDFITNTLDEIAYLQPNSPEVLSRLRAISGAALCVRYHQGQAGTIVRQWQRSIQQLDLKPQIEDRKPSKPVRSSERDAQSRSMDELHEQLREMKEFLARLQEERDGPRQAQRNARPSEQAAEKRREEERKRKEQEKEREAKEQERQEQERLEKERLEKERLEKERLEEERKQKEREESKQRERAAYNERIRQRAQRVREEREREKREAERKEEEEWTQAWIKYQEKWTQFKAATSREGSLRDAIPWPVKSGLYRDVKASNVEEFLKRALARDENPSRLRRTECRKWHPDMMERLLRGAQLGEAERMVIEMICRVATGLSQA